MFKKIRAFIEKRKQERIAEQRRKWYEIRGHVIKFYEDLQITNNELIKIPAFKLADEKMSEIIKTQKDLEFFYKKLKKHKLVA